VETKNSRMRAAFLYAPNDVRIEETEIPTIGPGQALVRVRVIGICPSDVRCVQREKEVFPFGEGSRGLSGHEWAGEVVDLVGESPNIRVGDRVVADVVNACGQCKHCRQGSKNLCVQKSYNIGGFADYVVVPTSHLLKIPANVADEDAFMSEPVSCCLNAVDRSGLKMGRTTLVIGDGPLGLVHVQLARAAGTEVILSGHHNKRLALGEEFGASLVVNSADQDVRIAVKEHTHGEGADVVMLAVGGKDALEEAIECCAPNGLINLFAGTYPRTIVPIDPNVLHYKQLTFVGSFDSLTDHYVRTLMLFSLGEVRVQPLISDRLPLERLTEGFRILQAREGVKVLIEM
jgi:L-iditol 2-dehydrogenase